MLASSHSSTCQLALLLLTLLGENLGFGPPPTRANKLHLNSSSTMATPAPLKSRRHCTERSLALVLSGHRYCEQLHLTSVEHTFSSNGSQLNTRNPVVDPQAKQPLSWLKPNCSNSIAGTCRGLPQARDISIMAQVLSCQWNNPARTRRGSKVFALCHKEGLCPPTSPAQHGSTGSQDSASPDGQSL